jgi:hypothetical protein
VHAFSRRILYISIATGAFAAARQFAFRMVGTKMTNRVRNMLFTRLLALDVAYVRFRQHFFLVSVPSDLERLTRSVSIRRARATAISYFESKTDALKIGATCHNRASNPGILTEPALAI